MKIFLAVITKELIGFMRSTMLVLLVLYSFTLDIYIAGSGIQLNPKNVPVGYVDYTGGGISRKILSHLHEPEFVHPKMFTSQKQLSQAIFNKKIIVGIIFNSQFEKNYRDGKEATIDILLDATAASQSLTTLYYLENIVLEFEKIDIPIKIRSHKLFNQNANEHMFMALAELLSIITLLTVVLTAVVFVKEKEQGTWDLMLLMPANPKIIILAKSISQVLIVTAGVIISLGFIIFGEFNIPMNGSFLTFILLTLAYCFSSAGIGLFIAAVAKNVMQVAQFSVIIMMPIIFLSGAWTPVYAMNPIFQKLSLFSPLRYYIEGSESLFFRGTAFIDVLPYFGGVIVLGIILYWYGFQKIGKLF